MSGRLFPDAEAVLLIRAEGLIMISNTPKGRGVFASSDLPAKSIIEISPVLILPAGDVHVVKTTLLDHYTYSWPIQDESTGKHSKTQAVVLGLGSMFNHSTREQNVGWERDLARTCIQYQALRDIKAGEELCINYGPGVWFIDEDGAASEGEEDGLKRLQRIQTDVES